MEFDLFKPKAPPLIGLDISSSSVKMVELVEAGKGAYRLERYAIEPLPQDAVVDGNINNLEAGERRAASARYKRLGTRTKQRRHGAADRRGDHQEDHRARPACARKSSSCRSRPRPTSTSRSRSTRSTSTSRSLGPAPNNPDEVEVLIAASRKEKVEDRVAVAEAAGLKAAGDGRRVLRAAERVRPDRAGAAGRRQDQNIALVDIGANVTHFYVLRNDQSVYTRDQAFGGNQLTQDIQRASACRPEEAETAKRTGGLPDNFDADVLQPSWRTLRWKSRARCSSSSPRRRTTRSTRSCSPAAAAVIPGLDELVDKRTQVPTSGRQPVRERCRPRRASSCKQLDARRAVADRRLRPRDAEVRSQ